MIDHLSALYELSTDTGVTFIYCNYKEPRDSTAYIKLAVKQICRRMEFLPRELQESYKKHYKNHSQPSTEELKIIFRAIALKFNRMFLVLDALDECTQDQRKELCGFFSNIVASNSGSGDRKPASTSRGIVKLFVASRKEPDIERAFEGELFPTIEIEAAKVNDDIALYTEAQIESRVKDKSLRLQNMMLKDKILTVLTAKAGGMYVFSLYLQLCRMI